MKRLTAALTLLVFLAAELARAAPTPIRSDSGVQMVPTASWQGQAGVGGFYYKTGSGFWVRNPDNTEVGPLVIGPGSGSVSSVGTGNGLQGGPITTSGTIDLRLTASSGLSKTLGGGSNELGIDFTSANTWTAAQQFNNNLLIAGTTANAFVDFADGSTASLSAASHCRLRYNNSTHLLESSCNGGSYTSVGAVQSVSNSDGTLTISPTTGVVVASIALGHANAWTGQQTFNTSDIVLGAGVGIAGTAGAGALSLGSMTGGTTLPTGNVSWTGASTKTVSFVSTGAGSTITLTAGAASTWDSDDGTVKAATFDRTTAGTLAIGGTATTAQLAAGVTLSGAAGAGALSLGSMTGAAALPTGSLSWAGASTKTVSIVSTGASSTITLTAGAASTWDSDDGTVKAATFDRTTAGTLAIGGTATTDSFPVATMILGANDASATPSAITLRGAGGSGTNIVGSNLTIAAGAGTGNAAPSYVALQAPLGNGGSGGTAETMADVVRFTYSSATPWAIFGSGEQTGTPVATTIRFPDASGTNIAGATGVVRGSLSTGTGASGDLVFRVGNAGGNTGTGQSTTQDILTLKGNYNSGGRTIVMLGSLSGSANGPLSLQSTTTAGTGIELDATTGGGGGSKFFIYSSGSGAGVGASRLAINDGTVGANTFVFTHSGSIGEFYTRTPSQVAINGESAATTPVFTAPSNAFTVFGGKEKFQALALPASPGVSYSGVTGSTVYCYAVAPLDSQSNPGLTGPPACIMNGAASLDASHTIAVTIPATVAGSSAFNVYRTVGGSNQGLIAAATVTDNGISATSAPPTRNQTADLVADSSASIGAQAAAPTASINVTGGSIISTAIATPSAPTLAITGGAAATIKYRSICHDQWGGSTLTSALVTTSVGPTTLSNVAYVDVTVNLPSGCVTSDIIRDTGGPSQGSIYLNVSSAGPFRDFGQTASAYTNPSRNSTGDVNSNGFTNVGMQRHERSTVSDAAYTMDGNDYVVAFTAISAARTVTGFSLAQCTSAAPCFFAIKDESGSASGTNTITYAPASGNIDGSATKVVVNSAYGSSRLYCTNANCFTY